MKKISFLLSFCLFGAGLIAQSNRQVQWAFSSKKTADRTYEVHLQANISGNYHLYAQDAGVEGPIPTSIKFTTNPLITITGKAREVGKPVKKYETAWKGNVRYFENTVEFIQVVKLKANVKTTLGGAVEFMVCNDSQCLPPSTVEFRVNVGG
jgi:Disulphide bond corrector protein DsbC